MNSLNVVLFPDGFILEKCATGQLALPLQSIVGSFSVPFLVISVALR